MSFSPNAYGNPAISRSVSVIANNNSGGTLPKGTIVQINSSDLAIVDPSIEIDVDATVGVLKDDILDGNAGEVVAMGTIENIPGGFDFGKTIYLSASGTLTDTKPSVGVGGFLAGDYVIRIGVIVKNAYNPAQKDLLVNLQVVGQL